MHHSSHSYGVLVPDDATGIDGCVHDALRSSSIGTAMIIVVPLLLPSSRVLVATECVCQDIDGRTKEASEWFFCALQGSAPGELTDTHRYRPGAQPSKYPPQA